ncbi:hypothetical protein [Streptomyces caatingaensis]|uniref:hypothetical protein n=1 Tax=Streptomyces caatingaensis TaxID=1678637 RepID=UPI0006727F91|nr:hypothetical protein [Streptomyces caatingaensis]
MSSGDLGKLRTNEPGKEAAVKALAGDIQPGVDAAGMTADEANGKVASALHGWATGSGLKDVQDEWGRQVKALQARLTADRNALQQALKGFVTYDRRTASLLERFQVGSDQAK